MKEMAFKDFGRCKTVLSNLVFFNEFTLEDLPKFIDGNNCFIVYESGETLIKEKACANEFFILLSGLVNVVKKEYSLPIATLKPGEIFGEIAFLSRMKRTCSIEAVDKSLAVKIDRDGLINMDMKTKEKIQDKLVQTMALRLVELEKLRKKKQRSFTKQLLKSKITILNEEIEEKAKENTNLKDQINTLETNSYLKRSDIIYKDPFKVLGLSKNATISEIKRAYRGQIKKYNPHIVESLAEEIKEMVNEGCKEINLAYSSIKKMKNFN